MENTKSFQVDIAGVPLVIETGLLAQQAAGAVTVSPGNPLQSMLKVQVV